MWPPFFYHDNTVPGTAMIFFNLHQALNTMAIWH